MLWWLRCEDDGAKITADSGIDGLVGGGSGGEKRLRPTEVVLKVGKVDLLKAVRVKRVNDSTCTAVCDRVCEVWPGRVSVDQIYCYREC